VIKPESMEQFSHQRCFNHFPRSGAGFQPVAAGILPVMDLGLEAPATGRMPAPLSLRNWL